MKRAHPALLALTAVCLLLVAACGDKHEPMKPTAAATTLR